MKRKRVAVLCSGGDSPGMNAAVRAVVRVGLSKGLEVLGVMRGYQGLLEAEMLPLSHRSVSSTIHQGGTLLKTARSEVFKKKSGLGTAVIALRDHGIDALIVVGGDGSFRGLHALGKVWKGQTIGIPATIDNDIYGSDLTIGFDTAVNTALDAIDKIRDTAQSHDRVFLIQVMGRDAGFIALEAGIGGGAEEILIPEVRTNIKQIADDLIANETRGKMSNIIVVSEGDDEGDAFEIAKKLKKRYNLHYRVSVIGYIQRGGKPTAKDRVLATKLGAFSIECVIKGKRGVMVGEVGGKLKVTPLVYSWRKKKKIDRYLYNLLRVLAT